MDLRPYFDHLYAAETDPYAVRTRWYERRKIALVLAALPLLRHGLCYEPGCGIGELTVGLAARCDAVLASDLSACAVAAARERTATLKNVELRCQRLPEDWPAEAGPETLDLIVLSEVTSFLTLDEVARVAAQCRQSLTRAGTLVACDWRPDFEGRRSGCTEAHAVLHRIGLAPLVCHEEPDFLLHVWSAGPASVAAREGWG